MTLSDSNWNRRTESVAVPSRWRSSIVFWIVLLTSLIVWMGTVFSSALNDPGPSAIKFFWLLIFRPEQLADMFEWVIIVGFIRTVSSAIFLGTALTGLILATKDYLKHREQ